LAAKSFEEINSEREAMIVAQIGGVRWTEKNAGRASGQRAEAYFFLDFLPTFSSMEKVGGRKCV
jgi:hypothetical protein